MISEFYEVCSWSSAPESATREPISRRTAFREYRASGLRGRCEPHLPVHRPSRPALLRRDAVAITTAAGTKRRTLGRRGSRGPRPGVPSGCHCVGARGAARRRIRSLYSWDAPAHGARPGCGHGIAIESDDASGNGRNPSFPWTATPASTRRRASGGHWPSPVERRWPAQCAEGFTPRPTPRLPLRARVQDVPMATEEPWATVVVNVSVDKPQETGGLEVSMEPAHTT